MALDDLKYSIRICDSHGAMLVERFLPFDVFLKVVLELASWSFWPGDTAFSIARDPETVCTATIGEDDDTADAVIGLFNRQIDKFAKPV